MTRARRLPDAGLFRAYWDDGLLDVLCGLGVLVIGIGWTVNLSWLGVVQVPLWILLWAPLRRGIVEPKAGFVEFSLARRSRTARRLWRALALGVAVLILTALMLLTVSMERDAGFALRHLVAGFPAVLVAIGASLAGVLTGARRFHAYGLALLAGAAATIELSWGPAVPLLAVGAVVVVVGACLLARFLRASRAYG